MADLSSCDGGVDDRVHAEAVDQLQLTEVDHHHPRLEPQLAQGARQQRCPGQLKFTSESNPRKLGTIPRP
jgi:hypothetical protein